MLRYLYFLLISILLIACSKEIIQQKLTVDVLPSNGGTVSPSTNSFERGSLVSLIATPSGEYIFKQWQGGVSGTNNPTSLTMDADKQVTGVFEKRQYPLSLTIEGNGIVREEVIALATQSQYPSGTTVRLTPQPAIKYEFNGWFGDLTSSANPLDIKIDKPISLIAKFALTKYAANKYVEKHTQVNQSTGWFQTNKLFAGNIFVDSSVVRNLYKANDGTISLSKFSGNGQGYFSNRPCLYYGDLNGDGKNDLLNNYWASPFGTNLPGFYATWEYDKYGFRIPHFSEGLTGARKFVFNDYYKTGSLQALVASSGVDTAPFPGDFIQILSFDADLKININTINQIRGYFHTAASGDIDGDGDVDILMYSGGGQSKMGPVYFENIGDGNFQYNANLITGLNYVENNFNNYYCVELFDVNKDGYLDIILGGGGKDLTNRILWGGASKTFSTSNQTVLPKEVNYSSVMDIAFSDIDKDGDIDIFLLSEMDYQGFGIQILENQNDKFIDVTSSRVDVSFTKNSLWFAWLRLFDLDYDGDYDLVADGYGYSPNQMDIRTVKVPQIYWINNGNGLYKSSISY